MVANVKGQATLDAAKARREARNPRNNVKTSNPHVDTSALAVVEPPTEKPKTLRQYEGIVEQNALRGAGYWRKAADALLAIKEHKLWKQAVDENGDKYPSFVVYAEQRFGFKKTYAYDLVKAASRKPEAITEGSARAEMRAENEPKPLKPEDAVLRMQKAWTRFEDSAGGSRDRAIDHDDFVMGYDIVVRKMSDMFRDFCEAWTPIPGEAVDISADAENVITDDENNGKPGHED